MRGSYTPQGHCAPASQMLKELFLTFLALSPLFAPSAGAAFAEANSPSTPQLPIIPPDFVQEPSAGSDPKPANPAQEFTLRHIFHHGATLYPELHRRRDIAPDDELWALEDGEKHKIPSRLKARSRLQNIHRLTDSRPSTLNPLLLTAWNEGVRASWEEMPWSVDEIPSPDHTDKQTVLTFARAAANAYVEEPGTGEWEDVNGGFNYSQSFGWQEDGLRGHIFVDPTNSTVIMGLKGTSMAVFDGAGTTSNDKENDNLFSGCCCGQGGRYLWKQVCDCATGTFTCNQTCLVKELKSEDRYYKAAKDLFGNVTSMYPDSNIWLSGHSLGGVLSSLLGLTYGVPVLTFEAYGDALAAARLGLPSPPGSDPNAPQSRELTGAYHFGHTADPIFMGVCNGATSGCSIAGYALESSCHTGQECIYDVVEDKGWRVSIGMHRIHPVIDQVLEAYNKTPECRPNPECRDCYNWKFYNSNGSEPSAPSSSSTSRTRTRTSTCKTPGWFGCLDPSTTTTKTVTTTSAAATTTSTTTTCSHYGWFGNCLDPSTTTTTAVVTSDSRTAKPASSTAITSAPTPSSKPIRSKFHPSNSLTTSPAPSHAGSPTSPLSSSPSSDPHTTPPSHKGHYWCVWGRCIGWGG
ncbi:MAG: hypothetical protein M4579_004212 [Chaenotheca gracillima]|nr:MAG: hypothetical protein M4579_004212 [Chaenotheca gracillima]